MITHYEEFECKYPFIRLRVIVDHNLTWRSWNRNCPSLRASTRSPNPTRVQPKDNLALLVEPIDKPVKPGSHAQRGLGDLDLDDGVGALGVAARGDVGAVEDLGVHVVAGPRVGVAGPDRGAPGGGPGVGTRQPFGGGDEEVVLSDPRDDVLEEGLDGVVLERFHARELVDDRSVPDLFEPPRSLDC